MVALAKFFDWRAALAIVKPKTFVGWQRTAFKMFWRWKSCKPGRPALPKNLRDLIGQMARENPTWGEERIANELSLKLGIRVSPRTVGKYLERGNPRGSSGRRWTTFVRNHAQAIVGDCQLANMQDPMGISGYIPACSTEVRMAFSLHICDCFASLLPGSTKEARRNGLDDVSKDGRPGGDPG
jgi:hypothetical protein